MSKIEPRRPHSSRLAQRVQNGFWKNGRKNNFTLDFKYVVIKTAEKEKRELKHNIKMTISGEFGEVSGVTVDSLNQK